MNPDRSPKPKSFRMRMPLVPAGIAACCAVLSMVPGHAQTQATFQLRSQQLSGNATPPASVYIADLNHDGVADVIEVSQYVPEEFFVYLANGDGTFKPGITYTFPLTYQNGISIATGDFNGDGNADLAVMLGGSNKIAVFLGKGDGTFQAPYFETIGLPAGTVFGTSPVISTFTASPLVAADYNRDGKPDLVVAAHSSAASALYFIAGNGNGTFGSAATPIYSVAPDHALSTYMTPGDFDGDGLADVAFLDQYNCNFGGECTTALHVLYGGGNGTFVDTAPYTYPFTFTMGTGDLNSDGRTDIFAVLGNGFPQQLAVWYGGANRTFALHTQSVADENANVFFDSFHGFTMADFNGDGRMDILGFLLSGSTVQARIFLASSSRGTFAEESVDLEDAGSYTSPAVAVFNKDPYNRPDILLAGLYSTAGNPNADAYLAEALNTSNGGFWGGCTYPPSSTGIRLCIPGTIPIASPVVVNASASSFGQLRKIELWVDGKKLAEQFHAWGQQAWFNAFETFAPGSHAATLIAADIDNRLQTLVYNFTVINCAGPASPGIHVCSPANGASLISPVQALAASNVTGNILRMEVWVDGVKKYTALGTNALSASIALAAGSHRFDYFAVNTTGGKWQSTEFITVK